MTVAQQLQAMQDGFALACRDLGWQLPIRHAPRYRYFRAGKHAYCWTVEPARDEKGRMRYASWVSRISKQYITPLLSTRRDHALRKDAKARALKLWKDKENK